MNISWNVKYQHSIYGPDNFLLTYSTRVWLFADAGILVDNEQRNRTQP